MQVELAPLFTDWGELFFSESLPEPGTRLRVKTHTLYRQYSAETGQAFLLLSG